MHACTFATECRHTCTHTCALRSFIVHVYVKEGKLRIWAVGRCNAPSTELVQRCTRTGALHCTTLKISRSQCRKVDDFHQHTRHFGARTYAHHSTTLTTPGPVYLSWLHLDTCTSLTEDTRLSNSHICLRMIG